MYHIDRNSERYNEHINTTMQNMVATKFTTWHYTNHPKQYGQFGI